MSKRSLLLLIVVGVFAALCGVALRHALGQRAIQKREAAYQRAVSYQSLLHRYSEALKPGMTRKEVEGYLRTNDVHSYTEVLKPGMTRNEVEAFLRGDGVSFFIFFPRWLAEDHAYADLVKIGQEEHPWYCSEQDVYIAFHFIATEPLTANYRASDTDTLKNISIFYQLGGCL